MSDTFLCAKSGRIIGAERALGDGFVIDPDFLPSCDCQNICKIKKEESNDSSFHVNSKPDYLDSFA